MLTKDNFLNTLEVEKLKLPTSVFSEVINHFYIDDRGESKCVGFGLCLDEESTRRALKLDGERFGTKTLRINRAKA
jgi:hypothetical protein